MKKELLITKRHLPHWELQGAIYFITFRTLRQTLEEAEQKITLEVIKCKHQQLYNLIAAIVMPDHVHLILSIYEGFSLSKIMQSIKGVSARKINIYRATEGSIWQTESFDRIVRSESDFQEKLNYMWYNPVKKGLVVEPQDYPGWYFNSEFEDFIIR
ncbi:MAG: transposase [bacterium]